MPDPKIQYKYIMKDGSPLPSDLYYDEDGRLLDSVEPLTIPMYRARGASNPAGEHEQNMMYDRERSRRDRHNEFMKKGDYWVSEKEIKEEPGMFDTTYDTVGGLLYLMYYGTKLGARMLLDKSGDLFEQRVAVPDKPLLKPGRKQ